MKNLHYFLYSVDPLGRVFIDGVYNTEKEADEALELADGYYGPEFDVGIACGIDELNEHLSQSYEAYAE